MSKNVSPSTEKSRRHKEGGHPLTPAEIKKYKPYLQGVIAE